MNELWVIVIVGFSARSRAVITADLAGSHGATTLIVVDEWHEQCDQDQFFARLSSYDGAWPLLLFSVIPPDLNLLQTIFSQVYLWSSDSERTQIGFAAKLEIAQISLLELHWAASLLQDQAAQRLSGAIISRKRWQKWQELHEVLGIAPQQTLLLPNLWAALRFRHQLGSIVMTNPASAPLWLLCYLQSFGITILCWRADASLSWSQRLKSLGQRIYLRVKLIWYL